MAWQDSETSKKRRRLLILAFLSVLIAIGLTSWLLSRRESVKPGTRRDVVEAIYGPADGKILAVQGKPPDYETLVWKDRNLVIEFDENDCVRQVMKSPSFIENVLRKLGF